MQLPTDHEFNALLDAEDHEEYMRVLVDILDDPDLAAPILLFPVDDDVVLISPAWHSDREITGILFEALHLDTAMRYGMLPDAD